MTELLTFLATLQRLGCMPLFIVAMGCLGAMVVLNINMLVMIIKDINQC